MLEQLFKSQPFLNPYQGSRIQLFPIPTKLCAVASPLFTDALAAAGIKFYCKTKDVNRRNTFDHVGKNWNSRYKTQSISQRYL